MKIHEKLHYENLGTTVLVNLHNGYSVIAMTNWNHINQNYLVTLYLKANGVQMISLIEKAENIEFNSSFKDIKLEMTKYVSSLLSEGFFDDVMKQYDYEMKCFDTGNMILESDRKSNDDIHQDELHG